MKEEDEWSPDGSSLHLNHSKLSDITAGKLSVKSQFINFNKAMASHQSSTCGFHRVSKRCNKKTDLSSSKEIQWVE